MRDAPRLAAALFDLDGTLVETRQDIATAVNLVLADRGLPALPVDQVARHVGRGARILLTRCLQDSGVRSPQPDEVDAAYDGFKIHYLAHLLDTTYVYPGIPGLCDRLGSVGVSMAVVTNKPVEPAIRILDGLGLSSYFPVVLGGESLAQRKPDPAPLLHALGELKVETARAVMVGDSLIDVEAARAARIPIAAVAWGYDSRETLIEASPDFLAEDVAALEGWILG